MRYRKFRRGDSFKIIKQFKDGDGNILTLNPETDQLNFTMREKPDGDAIIEKHIADITVKDNCYYITIEPSETQYLECEKYGYDIEVRIGTDFVRTVEVGEIELQPDYSYPAKEETDG